MGAFLAKLTLLVVATVLSLLLAEPVARLFVDPVNFLRPATVKDPILRRLIVGGSGGHDEWGFRNLEVPESAEIVALGDSQTYGNTATADNAWPAWLERYSGRSVYNLGMGGYGPWEYLHLLRTKVPLLDPQTIVVGLYFGNDLWNGFQSVYTVEHWADFRQPGFLEQLDASGDIGRMPGLVEGGIEQGSGGKRIRAWLRSYSVLWNMTRVAIGDQLRPLEMRYFYRSNVGITLVNDPDGSLVTSLQPVSRFRAVDFSSPRVVEGLRLTKVAMGEIALECERQGRELLVVLIPTKVNVFAEYAKKVGATSQIETIEKLVKNEVEARLDIESFLDEHGIAHVNPVEELRAHIGERIYPRTIDGHPSKEGYRVIAEVASRALPSLGTDRASSPSQ